MTTEDYRRKLTAILSADVKGYSRLMGVNEAETVRTITAYRKVYAKLVNEHHGRVVDSPGDNILAEFPSVVDAMQCAVEIQKVLKHKNAQLPVERRMEFRMGINLGDVIEDEGRLYGDGVNITARIEGLADPGGICISGTVYEHIKRKLPYGTAYLGEHSVKNIAEPVPVYRILMEQGAEPKIEKEKGGRLRRWRRPLLAVVALTLLGAGILWVWNVVANDSQSVMDLFTGQTQPTAGSPDRSSVAVLPFENMSGDSDQEYFSDGITEDIITDLSKISALFVIARNSTFVYKGQAVDIQDVGKVLGVAYVLEGSVRKEGDRVRITAQLLDAKTGGHVWAERYDRDLEDVFAVQDEVVEKIVAALALTLTENEQAHLAQGATDDLEAYDFAKRGWWYYHHLTPESNDQARQLFEMAIERDPAYVDAYAGLGFTHYEEWAQQWSQDPQTLERAFDLATEAINLDYSRAAAHALLSHVYVRRGEFDQAIVEQERAIALAPNDANTYKDLAETLIFAGRPEDAIEYIEKAMILNPHYPATYPFTLGFAYTGLGFKNGSAEQYEKAIEALIEAISLNPNSTGSYLALAFVYNETEREEEARKMVAQAMDINPQLSLAAIRESVPFNEPTAKEAFLDALRDAGLN
ncbi:MAG: tetratricopeptide repeat protein [Chloroflexi bacterium]|jgi:adenylate cyclase|nr:tetratricopeptide repeat protein [Chloroflexota bacterium]